MLSLTNSLKEAPMAKKAETKKATKKTAKPAAKKK
jgi:hypothetical protein